MDSSTVKKSPDELFTSDENDDVDKSYEKNKFGREAKEDINDSNRSTEYIPSVIISLDTNDITSLADANESNRAKNESVHNAQNLVLKRKLPHSEDQNETENDDSEKTDNADNMFVKSKLKRIKKAATRNSVAHGKKYQLRKSTGVNYMETESSDNAEGKERELKSDVKSEIGWTSDDQAEHNNRILGILNKGSLGDLKNLSRVGPKAAEMLIHFRKSHGPLDSLRDLENMSGWTAKVLKQFLASNGIVLD